jgi:hypothetical protein
MNGSQTKDMGGFDGAKNGFSFTDGTWNLVIIVRKPVT